MTKSNFEPIPEATEDIAKQMLDGAFAVHRTLGAGLLESVYHQCLCHELDKRDIQYVSECHLPIHYDGVKIDAGLRMDLWVEEKIVVEIKAVAKLLPVHEAQILSYMKLSQSRLGYLINFNSTVLYKGLMRKVL